MYRLIKNKGGRANIIVENTETKANVIIGVVTYDMLATLHEKGIDVGVLEDWNFPIGKELAQELCCKALILKKPVRTKAETQNTIKTDAPTVDAVDVLFGRATYAK